MGGSLEESVECKLLWRTLPCCRYWMFLVCLDGFNERSIFSARVNMRRVNAGEPNFLYLYCMYLSVFNRPGAARAVLQTNLSLIYSCMD